MTVKKFGVMPKEMECQVSTKKLNIAIVYSRSPVPMRRADQMTVAHLMSFLYKRGHAVDLYALRAGGTVADADESWLREHSRSFNLYKHTLWDMAKGLIGGIVRGLPLQVGIFQNSQQQAAVLGAAVNGRYDIIYVYYLRSGEIVKKLNRYLVEEKNNSLKKPPSTFLALQLSQSLNTKRIRDNSPNIWNKLLYALEYKLIARYETSIWNQYTKSVLIAQQDVDAINAECDRLGKPHISNYVFGAHGTDVSRFTPRDDVEVIKNRIIFSGVMRTPTNIQAVQWFVKNCWKLIRDAVPDATFEIVGREPTADVQALAAVPGVIVTGTVPDPALNIAGAQLCVNPMQAGGGMQNKLIEFLASEKPVVATAVANEGVGAPAGAISIANDAAAFADSVIKLLLNPEDAKRMAKIGRSFVVNNWTWEAHFYKLEKNFFQSVGADTV